MYRCVTQECLYALFLGRFSGCNRSLWLRQLRMGFFAFKAIFRLFFVFVFSWRQFASPSHSLYFPFPAQQKFFVWALVFSIRRLVAGSTKPLISRPSPFFNGLPIHGDTGYAARCSGKIFDAAVEIRFSRKKVAREKKKERTIDAFGLIKITLAKIRRKKKCTRKVSDIKKNDRLRNHTVVVDFKFIRRWRVRESGIW